MHQHPRTMDAPRRLNSATKSSHRSFDKGCTSNVMDNDCTHGTWGSDIFSSPRSGVRPDPRPSECVNELAARATPLLERRHGCDINKMAPFRSGADGVVARTATLKTDIPQRGGASDHPAIY